MNKILATNSTPFHELFFNQFVIIRLPTCPTKGGVRGM